MLTLPFSSPLQHITQEAQKTLLKITPLVTVRMVVAAASVVVILTSGIVLAVVAAGVPSCATGQSLLVYPQYNKRGVAIDFTYACGQPHATCGMRDVPLGNAPTYDCSPFMLPKG